MLGKMVGGICFIGAVVLPFFAPFGLEYRIFVVFSLFLTGAHYWIMGVCQENSEKIADLAERQKYLLTQSHDQNKRIVYLLGKIAGEEPQEESRETIPSNASQARRTQNTVKPGPKMPAFPNTPPL